MKRERSTATEAYQVVAVRARDLVVATELLFQTQAIHQAQVGQKTEVTVYGVEADVRVLSGNGLEDGLGGHGPGSIDEDINDQFALRGEFVPPGL